MRPGIKVIEETLGIGDQATKGKTVLIDMRMLPLDEQDLAGVSESWHKEKIDLARREHSAGLRYGVEGMRVGGRRLFVIGPGLSCCHAPQRCEVVLLEVRDGPVLTPEEYPPGKDLHIIHPGELSRSSPKWNFRLQQDGNYEARVTVPIPGFRWRNSRPKVVRGSMDPSRVVDLFTWVMEFPAKYPNQIVSGIVTWGGDSSWYLDPSKEVVCIHFGIWERGQYACQYYLPETCCTWRESALHQLIMDLVANGSTTIIPGESS